MKTQNVTRANKNSNQKEEKTMTSKSFDQRLYMDVHVIQVIPLTDVNQDGTGILQMSQYGGVPRAIMSPQEWEKAMRDYCKEHIEDAPNLNIADAYQVTFPMSTHAVEDVEFDIPTMYRYANVAIHVLFDSMKDEASTVEVCELFIEAFLKARPYGICTVPSVFMVTLRKDRPIYLGSAFELPVTEKAGGGYVGRSVEKLVKEYQKAGKREDVNAPLANFYIASSDCSIDGVGEACENLKDLLQKVRQKIEDCRKEGNDMR